MKKSGLFILSVFIIIVSCVSDNKSDAQDTVYYYAIKKFFAGEIAQLSKKNPSVEKTIIHNNQQETKTLKIDKWAQELALFSESDINKAAWKNSYAVDSTSQRVIYTAKEKGLRIKKAEIYFADGKPVKFKFFNKTSNYLYDSEENLEYYPDSLYIIHKKQKVVLLGDNDYRIVGRFLLSEL